MKSAVVARLIVFASMRTAFSTKGKIVNFYFVAEWMEWLEHRTKPVFVFAALLLYVVEIGRISTTMNPFANLDQFLVEALGALSVPFSVILLQELLELVAVLSDSNLVSARHQFEIVLLVIVRSFFKKFDKLNGYVDAEAWNSTVQEAIIKVFAIIAIMYLLYLFRRMAESNEIKPLANAGAVTNHAKQIFVIILAIIALFYQLTVVKQFDTIQYIRLVFTGLIVIEALFLILAIWKNDIGRIMLESSLIIALIFARFPLFTSNRLSYGLSVLGVAFATAALGIFYVVLSRNEFAAVEDSAESAHHH